MGKARVPASSPVRRAVLELGDHPARLGPWLREVWAHREVLVMLARSDFQSRYKRATFGIAWSVAIPVLQAGVLTVVFSHVIQVGNGRHFGAYVLGGVLAWGYFSSVVGSGSIAIVDGAALTEKVWFPRALLPLVQVLSNLPALGVSIVALLVFLPTLGVGIGLQVLWLVPASALLILFAAGLALGLAALHVYFRDVRFLVQAVLLMWFYVTPIAYPRHLLGHLARFIDLNPATGMVDLFHMATTGSDGPWLVPVIVSAAVTIAVTVIGMEANRRHDRLFVDLL